MKFLASRFRFSSFSFLLKKTSSRSWRLSGSIFFLLILAACDALPGFGPTPTQLPTRTPIPSVTPTATIVWFPPTRTPTPGVATLPALPTTEQRPNLGDVLFRDAFTETSGWQTGALVSGGSATLTGSQLTLSIPGAAADVISLRQGSLPQDFYLEIEVSVNLCRGKDNYGLVFRHDGSYSYYRWVLACDGLLRVERVRPAETAVIQDWTPSGQVTGGAPLDLRLGLWMAGSEMRFFINNVFQFAVRDPLVSGSQVGVFARSSGANAVSVSFSGLAVRKVVGFVPTPIPTATIYVTPVPTHAPTWTPVP